MFCYICSFKEGEREREREREIKIIREEIYESIRKFLQCMFNEINFEINITIIIIIIIIIVIFVFILILLLLFCHCFSKLLQSQQF